MANVVAGALGRWNGAGAEELRGRKEGGVSGEAAERELEQDFGLADRTPLLNGEPHLKIAGCAHSVGAKPAGRSEILRYRAERIRTILVQSDAHTPKKRSELQGRFSRGTTRAIQKHPQILRDMITPCDPKAFITPHGNTTFACVSMADISCMVSQFFSIRANDFEVNAFQRTYCACPWQMTCSGYLNGHILLICYSKAIEVCCIFFGHESVSDMSFLIQHAAWLNEPGPPK